MEGFNIFGTVKETKVDDEGLLTFHSEYFPFPLYRDLNLTLYNDFFNKKKFRPSFNPLKLYKQIKASNQRHAEKGIQGNLKGEGMVTGGVIIFDKKGEAKYVYEEVPLELISSEDIVAAVKAVRNEQEQSKE